MILHLYPFPCILKLKLVKSFPEDVCGLVEYDKGNITMKLKIEDWEKYYIHESCHVIQAIEKYIEQKLGDEEEAYLLQYITENVKKYVITKELIKNGRKRKNNTEKNISQKCSSTVPRKKIHKRGSRTHN